MQTERADLNAIGHDVIGEIWNDPRMSAPVYRFDIRSVTQAESTPGLPLMCIWNKVVMESCIEARQPPSSLYGQRS
jgi:hypothetical protein